MKENELYNLVKHAQYGDRDAMKRIIEQFLPFIRKAASYLPQSEAKDYEQVTTEKIVRAVNRYDLNSVPDFVKFCSMID